MPMSIYKCWEHQLEFIIPQPCKIGQAMPTHYVTGCTCTPCWMASVNASLSNKVEAAAGERHEPSEAEYCCGNWPEHSKPRSPPPPSPREGGQARG